MFGRRSGGSTAYHHIDNISIRTGLNAVGLRGHYDSNGLLEAADLDAMAELILEGDLAADLDDDGDADQDDRLFWVNDLANTWVGDSNFDGEFNCIDFVQVFQAAKFESADAASWEEGDRDGNGKFESTDFVFAFQNGGYEMGARAAVAAVPEPSSWILVILGLLGVGRIRSR